MTYIKIKVPLHSILLLLCVVVGLLHAFGVPSDSPQNIGLGRHLDLGLGLSQNPLNVLESGNAWSQPEHVSGDPKYPNELSRRSASLGMDLAEAESVQNYSSELSALFSVSSGNASVDSSSQSSVITLERESSAKAEPTNPNVSGIASFTSNDSRVGRPRPTPTFSLSSSKPLVVPSEGGLMQDLSSVSSTEARNTLLKGESSAGNMPRPVGPQVEESETRPSTVGLGLGLDLNLSIHQGDIPVVNKQLKSQDSHISARKGANLSEKTESTSRKLNGTTEQFTFSGTSSELPYVEGSRTQKIAPRKGVDPPKIYPRKGVKDQSVSLGSSDLFLSETNDTSIPIPTTIATHTQPLVNSPWPATIRPTNNPAGIVKGVTTNRAIIFQNSSRIDVTQKAITPSVGSDSSDIVRPNALAAATSKSDNVSDIGVKKSNVSSNITPPLIGGVNDTLDRLHLDDKSGIIAFPPLKKRLKPLKTTDTNALNSSPVPPEHISGGHDYVVPIVVTILTVPMLVVLVLFLYKKGAEFWERRHYRRMDFLIDGMYND